MLPASSSHRTPKTITTTSEVLPSPKEYVSLFQGATEALQKERDSRLNPYAAVLTGFNKLLVEVANYTREKYDPPEIPSRQVFVRLL